MGTGVQHPRTERAMVARDTTPLEGGKPCTSCGRVKPLAQFSWLKARARHHSWCRTCHRLDVARDRETEQYRLRRAAYDASPARIEARREAYERRKRDARHIEYRRRYNALPRTRLAKCRCQARRRLKDATDEKRRARLLDLIAAYDREIARLDAREDRD